MKKIICLVICVTRLLLGLDSFGQWNLNGNLGVGSTNFLGTIDSSNLNLKTNNAVRMKIMSNGKILMGPLVTGTKAIATLHITGSNAEPIKTGFGGDHILRLKSDLCCSALDFGVFRSLDSRNVYSWIQARNDNNVAVMEKLVLNPNGGNVGIGTAAPLYTLDIHGAARIQNGNTLNFTRTDGAAVGAIGWHSDGSFYVGGHPEFGATAGSRVRIYGFGDILSLGNGTSDDVLNITSGGKVGIGTATPSQKLQVNGNICYTGSIAACSDIRYKKSISPLTNSLNSLMALQGVYYSWDNDKFSDKGFTEERQIGFSAQEIEKLFPEIVQTDSEGYKAVDYSRLTPILVEAIKEQQKQIDELNRRLEKLEKILKLSK